MLPEGISFIGGNWDTVLTEIAETCASRCLLDFIQIKQTKIDPFYTLLEEILSFAETSPAPFDHIYEQAPKLFRETLSRKSKYAETVRLIVQSLCFCFSGRCDRLVSLLFIILSDIVGTSRIRNCLPDNWQILWDIMNPINLLVSDTVSAAEVVGHLTRATCFCSNVLRAQRHLLNRSSICRVSLSLTRIASSLAVHYIMAGRPSEFDTALQFLVISEALDFDVFRCCVTFLTSALFESLRSLHLFINSVPIHEKDTVFETHFATLKGKSSLLDIVLHELRRLQQFCGSVTQTVGLPSPQVAPVITFPLIAILLFDRLLALLLVQGGITYDVYPHLWNTLFADSCKSVDNWARFFLSIKIVED
ncbi:hypothetical protein D915_008862 [Fasciola hepatica]|uniref:Uncharacterized protein n=1 Tax=Fasciola hepatica TaxID=6192 RepID=A0A4E0QYM8_FASHE|nr:hypothetical protein D915_008862 [Fasciola hepatica]